VEVTTSSNTEPLLSSRASYPHNLFSDDKLRSFWSHLMWMCIDQFDTRHSIVSRSLFLLLSIFSPTTFHIILLYIPTPLCL
ncbi:hypothetical protein GW17_00035038, partial [Ensete ventricosum]